MASGIIPASDEIAAMSELEYKVLENRLRRAAERQGLRLQKSRARDRRAVEWSTYQLVDATANTPVAYGLATGYGLRLDDVARALFSDTVVNVHAPRPDSDPDGPLPDVPFIAFRAESTTGAKVDGRPVPDGWVLHTEGGSQWIIGSWCSAEAAVVSARDWLKGLASISAELRSPIPKLVAGCECAHRSGATD